MGIDKYNAECRSIVTRYSKEWETVVTVSPPWPGIEFRALRCPHVSRPAAPAQRMGRWIDFENDYKTMDPNFMESVWWVFSELWRKGLVYRSFKVMPYSTACTTPLSNFEANQVRVQGGVAPE